MHSNSKLTNKTPYNGPSVSGHKLSFIESSPFRMGGRGAKQLAAVFNSASQSELLAVSPNENERYVLVKGRASPCFAKVVSEKHEGVYIQPLIPWTNDPRLLIPWKGHLWLAKSSSIETVQMKVHSSGSLEVISNDSLNNYILSQNLYNRAFTYPSSNLESTEDDNWDVISLQSSEYDDQSVGFNLIPKIPILSENNYQNNGLKRPLRDIKIQSELSRAKGSSLPRRQTNLSFKYPASSISSQAAISKEIIDDQKSYSDHNCIDRSLKSTISIEDLSGMQNLVCAVLDNVVDSISSLSQNLSSDSPQILTSKFQTPDRPLINPIISSTVNESNHFSGESDTPSLSPLVDLTFSSIPSSESNQNQIMNSNITSQGIAMDSIFVEDMNKVDFLGLNTTPSVDLSVTIANELEYLRNDHKEITTAIIDEVSCDISYNMSKSNFDIENKDINVCQEDNSEFARKKTKKRNRPPLDPSTNLKQPPPRITRNKLSQSEPSLRRSARQVPFDNSKKRDAFLGSWPSRNQSAASGDWKI